MLLVLLRPFSGPYLEFLRGRRSLTCLFAFFFASTMQRECWEEKQILRTPIPNLNQEKNTNNWKAYAFHANTIKHSFFEVHNPLFFLPLSCQVLPFFKYSQSPINNQSAPSRKNFLVTPLSKSYFFNGVFSSHSTQS